eukprot:scaffold37202_cov47-Prasinocladus_malaysianus.AAC.3
MSQDEVVKSLREEAQIQPRFTTLVWQKLEEQNPEFFRAYYTRLKLKDQIVLFNHLLEQQVQMFQKIQTGWVQQPNHQLIAGQLRPGMQIQALPSVSAGFPRSALNIQPMATPTSVPIAMPSLANMSMPPPASRPAASPAPNTSTKSAGRTTQEHKKASSPAVQQMSPPGTATALPGNGSVSAPGPVPMDFTAGPVAGTVSAVSAAPSAFPVATTELDFQIANSTAAESSAANANIASTSGLTGQIPKNFSLPDLSLELNPMPNDNEASLELLNNGGAGELEIDMSMI